MRVSVSCLLSAGSRTGFSPEGVGGWGGSLWRVTYTGSEVGSMRVAAPGGAPSADTASCELEGAAAGRPGEPGHLRAGANPFSQSAAPGPAVTSQLGVQWKFLKAFSFLKAGV